MENKRTAIITIPKKMKNIIKMIDKDTENINIHFKQGGLIIYALNNYGASYMEIIINAYEFEQYTCITEFDIHISSGKFKEIIKTEEIIEITKIKEKIGSRIKINNIYDSENWTHTNRYIPSGKEINNTEIRTTKLKNIIKLIASEEYGYIEISEGQIRFYNTETEEEIIIKETTKNTETIGTVINLKHLNRYLKVRNIRTTELKILNNGCLQLHGVPADLETELCYYIAPLTPKAMKEHAPSGAVLPSEELTPAK